MKYLILLVILLSGCATTANQKPANAFTGLEEGQLLIAFTYCGKTFFIMNALRFPDKPGMLNYGSPTAFIKNKEFHKGLAKSLKNEESTEFEVVPVDELMKIDCGANT